MRNKEEMKQVAKVALAEVVLVGLMIAVYAVIGKLTPRVLLGAGVGAVVAILNFFFLSVTVTLAANKAENAGDATKATLAVRGSATVRMIVMGLVLILVLKFAECDPIATLLPLLFVQPGIMVIEYFRKDDNTSERS